MARWSFYVEGGNFSNREGGNETNKNDLWADGGISFEDRGRNFSMRSRAIAGSYKDGVLRLLTAGKHVVLVYPVPEVGWDVPVYAAKKLIYLDDDQVSTSQQVFVERSRVATRALDEIGEHPNLTRVRPSEIFCNTHMKDRCIATLNHKPLYYDDDHLSNTGADLVVNKVIGAINERLMSD